MVMYGSIALFAVMMLWTMIFVTPVNGKILDLLTLTAVQIR